MYLCEAETSLEVSKKYTQTAALRLDMALSVGSSLTGGFRRVANRNGMLLAFGYVLVGGVWQVLLYSAITAWIPQPDPASQTTSLPTVDIPLTVSAAGAVVSLLTLQYLTIVSIRTFVGGHSRSIPAAYYTRNIGFVLVNAVLGGLVYSLIILIGSILLVVPGIIAYVAFVFVLVYVAAEDENVIAAFRSSWNLTRGHWLRLFLLLLVVTVGLSIVPSVIAALTQLVVGAVSGFEFGTLISGVVVLPFSLLVLGILAEAFTQLREAQSRRLDRRSG